jgi:hypothetical protein
MRAENRSLRRLGLPPALALAATATVLLLAGCTNHGAPPISAIDLSQARFFKEFTVYWAGTRLDGIPLTAADSPLDFINSSVGFALYYGDCLGRGTFHAGGCTLPLKITTVRYRPHSDALFGPQHWILVHHVPAVVYGDGDKIEIYTDRQAIDIVAATPRLASDAAQALAPFNRTPTASFPAFPQPYFTPNPTPEDLAARAGATGASGATGPSGVTGATTNLVPASQLEPPPATRDGG